MTPANSTGVKWADGMFAFPYLDACDEMFEDFLSRWLVSTPLATAAVSLFAATTSVIFTSTAAWRTVAMPSCFEKWSIGGMPDEQTSGFGYDEEESQ
jgi:hypothetical protein